MSREAIIALLDRYRVRATYGAVAAIVGEPAMFLMNNLPRTPLNSWVVNQDTHLPTGYTEAERHPDLLKNKLVLDTKQKLHDWIERKSARKDP